LFILCDLEVAFLYYRLDNFARIRDFTWRLSDCEELVAPTEEASRNKSGTIQ
jgi:hypothetical protein